MACTKEGGAVRLAAIVDDGYAGVAARQTGSIFHASKSARYVTVKVTVDGNMSEQIARIHAGLQVQDIIEWE